MTWMQSFEYDLNNPRGTLVVREHTDYPQDMWPKVGEEIFLHSPEVQSHPRPHLPNYLDVGTGIVVRVTNLVPGRDSEFTVIETDLPDRTWRKKPQDKLSDTSSLNDEQKEKVAAARADFETKREGSGIRTLSSDKQNFPVGLSDISEK